MALDCYIGLFSTDEPIWAESVLAEINALLLAAGLPPHVEPREVDESGPRLGFYGSEKYGDLDVICRQLRDQGRITADAREQPWTEPTTSHPPLRRLAHLSLGWNRRTFLLPYNFAAPIISAHRSAEVSALISAPMLIEESALLLICSRGAEAWDWQWWERTQTAQRLGLTVPEDDALERHWGGATDLAWRLSCYATAVIRSGAVGYTG